jgi:hypothetical protein
MLLETTLSVLNLTPVSALLTVFKTFRFIVSCVQNVQESKKQLCALADALGQLLAALQKQFEASRLIEASCVRPLTDLEA